MIVTDQPITNTPGRRAAKQADTIGWIVAVLIFVVLMSGVVFYSYSRWNHNIARAPVVHPDWKVRQGTVVSDDQPDFSNDPPDRESTVQFTDYYGRSEQVSLYLPYRSNVGDAIQIDVGKRGNIWSPSSTEWYNQVEDNPVTAHPNFWPAVGIVIGGIISFIIALIVGLFTANTIPRVKGRLGTR